MNEAARRWRLVLGRYAGERMNDLGPRDARRDEALSWLYDREYRKRGIGGGGSETGSDRSGVRSLAWLGEIRNIFPATVCERLQADAMNRYRLAELLRDPEVLDRIQPYTGTLLMMLSLQGTADPALKALLHQTARRIVDELLERTRQRFQFAFSGKRNRFQRSNVARAANFDARTTLRQNLRNWDAEGKRIVAERLRFNARARRHLPWEVVLCVDQSGSMANSVVHSALVATVLLGLPAVSVRMVLFDTRVVDVSDRLSDPLETLLAVQLGGGTHVAQAVTYCAERIDNPTRTIFVLVTDFCEGGPVRQLEAAIARMTESRVRTLGLASLQDDGAVYHDHPVAQKLADLGMEIGAMTPDALAGWLAEAME